MARQRLGSGLFRWLAEAGLVVALGLGLGGPSFGGDGMPSKVSEGDCSPSVKLVWRASTETGVYGYLVFRAENRVGPFLRRNVAIIRAEGVEDEGVGRYVFVDCEVEEGQTYYYYLDYVTNTGLKLRFSGVQTKQVERVAGCDPSQPEER